MAEFVMDLSFVTHELKLDITDGVWAREFRKIWRAMVSTKVQKFLGIDSTRNTALI